MVKYSFEFMDHKYVNKLIGILFLSFFIILFGLLFITLKLLIYGQLVFIICFLLALAIPTLIFQLKKKKVKQNGNAIINDSYTEFNLGATKSQIYHIDIQEYSIQENNGATLRITLKNKGKFIIASSNVYCNTTEFVKFCDDFQNRLEKFQKSNHIKIIRKKSFFEKKWVFPFLVVFTIAIIVIIIYALINGKQIPSFRLLAAIAPLMTLWGSYFSAKRKK